MQMKRSKKLLSFILCIALTVAMALFTTGCNGGGTPFGSGTEEKPGDVQIDDYRIEDLQGGDAQTDGAQDKDTQDGGAQDGAEQLGEGSTRFMFTVVDGDGGETYFEIHTDKETVGDALLELELIAGDEGEFGLFVKTVNGITVDYDKDGKYWAFYIDDEYAPTGVDATAVTEGASYAFKVE